MKRARNESSVSLVGIDANEKSNRKYRKSKQPNKRASRNAVFEQSSTGNASPLALLDTENSEASLFESKCTSDEPQTGRLSVRTSTPCFNRNGVRGIYTLFPTAPLNCKPFNYALLRNGFYLMKVAKTDEKVRYTYTEMNSIVRCLLFVYAFDHSPRCSMLEMIHSTEPYDMDEKELQERIIRNRGPRPLDFEIARLLLDECFGENFSTVTACQVKNVVQEYKRDWRYSVCGAPVRVPSNLDFVLLQRFVNAPLSLYTDSTLFVNTNLRDNKILLQNNPKRLDNISFHRLEENEDTHNCSSRS